MAEEWKKAAVLTIGGKDFTANKKYDYVLVSDPSFKASGSYTVSISGSAACHKDDTSGTFKNTGTVTNT